MFKKYDEKSGQVRKDDPKPEPEKYPEEKPVPDTGQKEPDRPEVENLPLGHGYEVEDLPTEVIVPEIRPITLGTDPEIEEEVPGEASEELNDPLWDPIPSPEDDYYDFDKGLYGDEAEIESQLKDGL